MKTQRRPKSFPQPDGPAIIRAEHAKDRIISPIAGAPRAWRNLSPLEAAYAKNQLAGGNRRYSAAQRFEAGMNYAQLFLIANGAGGRDSTQAMTVSGSCGGYEPPQSQHDAICFLARIESHMGPRDCRIIRRVCGEGHKPATAIMEICGDYDRTAPSRFREALDNLIEALEAVRRGGKRAA